MILRTVSIELQIEPIAAGFIEILDESELRRVQRGILPAKKVRALQTALEERIRSTVRAGIAPSIGDQITAIIRGEGPQRITDFDVYAAMMEATSAIVLEVFRVLVKEPEAEAAT